MIESAHNPFLVAHASKYGSTREVAEVVAHVLAERGHHADVRAAAEVRDLASYHGVVLGGGLYVGRLHRDALRFLKRHRDELSGLPLAVFAMGPSSLADDEVAKARAQLESSLAKVPAVTPDAVAIFGGVVDPSKFPFPLNRMPASDARDWEAIVAWSGEIAGVFEAQAVPL
jgi:menaquinone-dependent protoporphyrinogen oxidase